MKQLLFTHYFILTSLFIYAQTSGSLDATFGTNGKVITSMSSFKDRANDVVVQKDGKILVVGISYSTTTSVFEGIQMVRLNPNGSFDNTFGTNGKVNTKIDTAKSLYANNVALQSDGKIIVAGTYEKGIFLIRYNTNGLIDNSFDGDGIATIATINNEINNIFAIAVQADDKILIAGENYPSQSSNAKTLLLRFNINGSLDNTFNTNGKVITDINSNFPDRAFELALQSNGKILLCGHVVTNMNYRLSSVLIRYNVNGTIDATFGINGIVIQPDSEVRAVKVLSNGNILSGGSVFDYNNNTSFNGLFRYNSNGVLDNTFGTNGILKSISGSATDMILQLDSKIILVSTTGVSTQLNRDLILARYNSNGMLDNAFGTNGVSLTKAAFSTDYRVMASQADGKIVVCGDYSDSTKTNFAVLRFNNTIGTANNIIESKEKISVYPNPCKNDLMIKLDDIDVEKLQIEIIDILGHIWVQKNYEKINKSQDIRISFEKLPSGLYFIHFKSDNIHQTQSVLKQ